MYLRALIVTVLGLFFSCSIKAYYDKISLSSSWSLEKTTVFSGEGRYSPNIGSSIAFSLWYSGFGIYYKSKLAASDSETLGKSNSNTFSAFFGYKKFLFQGYYRNFEGFFLLQESEGGIRPTESEKLHPIRSDISVSNFALNTYFVLLTEDFSLPATLFQTEQHPKSGISPIAQLAIFGHNLTANGPVVPNSNSLAEFWQSGNDVLYEEYNSGKMYGLALPLGIGGTGLIDSFFASFVVAIGPSFILRTLDYSGDRHTKPILTFRAHVTLAAGYNSENFFLSGKIGYDEDEGSLSLPLLFAFQVRFLEIMAGIRF